MNTLRTLYPEMLMGGVTSFNNLVIAGKMIENAMKSGRIEAKETKEGITLKKEKVNESSLEQTSDVEIQRSTT